MKTLSTFNAKELKNSEMMAIQGGRFHVNILGIYNDNYYKGSRWFWQRW